MLTAALVALLFVPAAGASTGDESISGTLTYLAFDTGDTGVVRGVYADLKLENFTTDDIDDLEQGGIVVRLHDAFDRTISQVTLRKEALSEHPGVPGGTKFLSAPIDSVWGTFDYAADGYWIQPRKLRINGGNCPRIAGAEVTVQLGGDEAVTADIAGPPSRSCDDIRR